MAEEEGFGFASEDDAPIPYLERIRDYYQALGYGAPYRWAHYAEVPFAPLTKPLGEKQLVGLVYGCTEVPSEEHLPLYKRPIFWAAVVCGVFLLLQFLFW